MRFIARFSCFCIGCFSSCCLVKHKYANNNSFCSLGAISIESRSIVFFAECGKGYFICPFLVPFCCGAHVAEYQSVSALCVRIV